VVIIDRKKGEPKLVHDRIVHDRRRKRKATSQLSPSKKVRRSKRVIAFDDDHHSGLAAAAKAQVCQPLVVIEAGALPSTSSGGEAIIYNR
jgi:hypothetical protein